MGEIHLFIDFYDLIFLEFNRMAKEKKIKHDYYKALNQVNGDE